MKHQTNQVLFEYWNDVRGLRMAPQRFEIEPARFASILPDTFILETGGDFTFPYRLAGTRICTQFGSELRSKSFFEAWDDEDQVCLHDVFDAVTSHAAVGIIEARLTTVSGQSYDTEITLLPLTHTQKKIDRILGAFAFDQSLPWHTIETIRRCRLLSCSHIWPDGRPARLVEQVHRQVPFLPQIRHSRVVRQNQRQFRVYDGGLADSVRDKS